LIRRGRPPELTTIRSPATSIVQFQTLPESKPFLIRVSDEAFVA
jgi:hypothetical protein